jgi:glycerophosphoryl diester phosphodiesterase
MNERLTIHALAQSVWHDFFRARRALFIFEVLFKLLEAWVFLPAVAVVLAAVLAHADAIAVSNKDIVDFLLTPPGLVYAVIFGTVAAGLLLLEQAGIMLCVAHFGAHERPPLRQVISAAAPKVLRVVQIGALMAGAVALSLLPFILLAVVTYHFLLSQHDIYYYLQVRPPVFWLAAGIGVILLLAATLTVVWVLVRWAFALPIALYEDQAALAALRASSERVRGSAWRIAFLLTGWLLGTLLLGMILAAGFRLLAASVLELAGERPVVPILALLLAQGGLLATWSFVAVVGHALITRRLYLVRSEQLGFACSKTFSQSPEGYKPPQPWSWRLFFLTTPILLVAPLALWVDLTRYVAVHPMVQVTAHRGHSRAAPENTLSAIRKAIESGADYAEVDVQQTADGRVVLLHDRDLKRVAGDSRRLEDLKYDQVRAMDVGRWFDSAFAGERVPTLEEAIALARGNIRLNIELKFFGADRRLAAEVARILREENFESDCIVTSLNYDALLEVKQANPRLHTGLIVAHALGDVSTLDVEALSVRSDFLSDDLLRAAHRRGREVHVWSLSDARQMAKQIKRGVNNLITSDPDLAIQVRDEWANLNGAERLVVASRLLLGLDP